MRFLVGPRGDGSPGQSKIKPVVGRHVPRFSSRQLVNEGKVGRFVLLNVLMRS